MLEVVDIVIEGERAAVKPRQWSILSGGRVELLRTSNELTAEKWPRSRASEGIKLGQK